MRKDKDIAIEMRKSGLSYRQIRAKLKIPLSTLSEWFSGEEWSQQMRAKLTEAANIESAVRIKELDRVRGEHLAKVYEEAREEARKELELLKYNPLFIAGMMLYWGEGDRKGRQHVRLNNADPELMRLFVLFLTQACRIPPQKLRANVLVYPDIEEVSNKRFWSFATGIPLGQFTKSVLIQGKHPTNRLKYGVCSVVVSSTYLKAKVLEWLKYLPKELMNREYYEIIPE